MADRKPFVGGNWKMNTNLAAASELARSVADGVAERLGATEVAIFPPFPYLLSVGSIIKSRAPGLLLGAQDCWHRPDGAFTGEVSTSMLLDAGVQAVLIGHSERRHVMGDSEETIRLKLQAVLDAELRAVLCIGETLEQREAGETDRVNEGQLRSALAEVSPEQFERVTVAYEPVWAIGTGKTATPEDAQGAHAHVRGVLTELFGDALAGACRIQYGGSVKPANAGELFACPDIDGGLIGGASLKAADFQSIVEAAG
ncbi:MAG: triose-phosphate isomerase [Planctomycetota bacterium]